MRKVLVRLLLASAIGAVPAALHAQSGGATCADITAKILPGAVSAAGNWVAANAAEKTPGFCEVHAVLSPAAGSTIGVVYRLPEAWNGKMLGLGGGGWAGNLRLSSAMTGLKQGYATAQTDGGHGSTSPWNTDWSTNPESVTDFAYRAINRMTVAGKALVKAHYGRAQDKAYFHGCSTGGRMALMEAQRFPNDYDAIIAEAPVYTLQVQSSGVLRSNIIQQGGGFTAGQMSLINAAVLKACDGKDGIMDGVIGDPGRCDWAPKAIACAAGQSGDSCLAPRQVSTLETLYKGIKAPDGSWAMLPLRKGGEAGWSLFIKTDGSGVDQASGGGMPGLSHLLFGKRKVDFSQMSADKDVPEARASAFANMYEAKNPDLSKFIAHGGKLLLWHGESDPGPSPVATADYYQAALKSHPDAPASIRLFMGPGVGHCRGGPGADILDNLGTIDAWVTGGNAPEQLIATRMDGSMTRTLCAWPKVARMRGEGNPNDPANQVCEMPASN